jgi:hypothetical protein
MAMRMANRSAKLQEDFKKGQGETSESTPHPHTTTDFGTFFFPSDFECQTTPQLDPWGVLKGH